MLSENQVIEIAHFMHYLTDLGYSFMEALENSLILGGWLPELVPEATKERIELEYEEIEYVAIKSAS